MDLSSSEKKISEYITQFIQYSNIDVANSVVNSFMNDIHKRRTLNISSDTFAYVCEFLCPFEILSLIACCKSYDKYHEYVWNNIAHYFNCNSIIPRKEFSVIRESISLDMYYTHLFDIKYTVEKLETIETRMRALDEELSSLLPNSVNYKVRYIVNHGELMVLSKERDSEFNKLGTGIQDILTKFLFNSVKSTFCIYYTQKKELDPRLYGFPKIKKPPANNFGGFSLQKNNFSKIHKNSKEKDAGEKDAGEKDAGEKDAGEKDAGEKDAGEKDAGEKDAGEKDNATEHKGEYTEEHKKGEILLKWQTGEYNCDPDYDYDGCDTNDPDFEYETGYSVSDTFRVRIMPRYVGVILFKWCTCECYMCEGKCELKFDHCSLNKNQHHSSVGGFGL